MFTIIVGDLVRSRESSGRQQISRKIRLTIGRVSRDFRDEFYAPLVLTRGIDEVCGVLKRPDMSYRICSLVNQAVSPRVFRFAVVRGALDIAVASKDARTMDGPAFHVAADMIQQAKKRNLFYSFDLASEFADLDPWLSEVANLLQILRSSWSKHQLRVVRLYEQLGSQKAAANKLSITQQAVSDALRQAHWRELKRAEDLICDVLGKRNPHK